MAHSCLALKLTVLIAVVSVLSFVPGAAALDRTGGGAIADEIAAQIQSPFCPGKMLRDCPSSSAGELREEIRAMFESGKTRDEVMQILYQRYGDDIAAVPQGSMAYIGWITPGAAVILGMFLVGAWLRRVRSQPEPTEDLQQLTAREKRIIDQEIAGD